LLFNIYSIKYLNSLNIDEKIYNQLMEIPVFNLEELKKHMLLTKIYQVFLNKMEIQKQDDVNLKEINKFIIKNRINEKFIFKNNINKYVDFVNEEKEKITQKTKEKFEHILKKVYNDKSPNYLSNINFVNKDEIYIEPLYMFFK
jgi:5'-3' exonuclease